ncbi:hypothetical protein DT73_10940 [Mangrovibacter sp. MFB070]|uniref:hypothetical protein n=1 Tax=Mangrovibacter sp. MFB070 TaxID=1224318 RepID=UPI0004D5042C|nr:hypothetical protein [Mangrovibacter sp. MFB070]KEA52614.1 hypothetical protein DT73_10940 [Mangrovibacter sp. MFB070]
MDENIRVENNALKEDSSYDPEKAEHERETGDDHIKIYTVTPGLEPERDEEGDPVTYPLGTGAVPIGAGGSQVPDLILI